MANQFKCTECGYQTPKELGRCPHCDEFGTFEKMQSSDSKSKSNDEAVTTNLAGVDTDEQTRIDTGINELNRVVGGGVVPGSVLLLGGPPGIGKSTLLLQWGTKWPNKDVLYINGEESPAQIARRANRIEASPDCFNLTHPEYIENVTKNMKKYDPGIVFVDSIQTVKSEESNGSPGHPSQMRAVVQELVEAAKRYAVPFVLIGHVTKEGQIGGPKLVEHMVDTVLYFDSSQGTDHRFLRATKNRFGQTGELGIFEMTARGLNSIDDPGAHFRDTQKGASGCALSVSMEGTRPLLVEVQALAGPTQYSSAQRTTTGYPYDRLLMLCAVIEKRFEKVQLNEQDVFINIAGGLQLDDPGLDLAATLSIISSFADFPIQSNLVAMGEVGLTGHLRTPSNIERRAEEARRLTDGPILIGGETDRVSGDRIRKISTLDNARKVLDGLS